MRKIKNKQTKASKTKQNYYLEVTLIILLIIAVEIIAQPKPYNGFQPLQMQLTSYPKQARAGKANFTLLINDSRANQTYVTTVYLNQQKQYTKNLKNGTNALEVNLTKKGLQKVTISIYNPTNEYNGYGYKEQPFTLSFMVNVK